MTTRSTQELADCREIALVGGKAASLGRLLRAGFPVPPGFAVTTRAFRFAQDKTGAEGLPAELPAELATEIIHAYHALGAGKVAVRSSATAEDLAAASMAGQYETFLDIEGEPALLDAVRRCWASLETPRTRAYLHEHGIDATRIAMAVIIQRLIPADVAGVLFTTSPHEGHRHEMLLEASWGLGESVVGGRVQPDILHVERATGKVLAAAIADKQVQRQAGTAGEQPVSAMLRRQPCLRGRDVHHLWELGTRIAAHFGAPQDVEWALVGGEIYLLQSRPITTHQVAEAYETVLRETRETLRRQLAENRGPWVLHNLAETLPHPTPLTWSIIDHFMSAHGGFGALYRQAGFTPSAAGGGRFLERIAGRIYMDAARAPEMFCTHFPYAYDVEVLKRGGDAAQAPPTLPRGTLRARLKAGTLLARAHQRLTALSASLDRDLRERIFPDLQTYVEHARCTDLHHLPVDELITLWRERERRIMDEFGANAFLPSLICGMALTELRIFLAEHLWDADADTLAQTLSVSSLANRTLLADAELFEVARGQRTLEVWLADHGHRAAGEFDLATPRWRERPAELRDLAARLATGVPPLERHRRSLDEARHRIAALRQRLPAAAAAELDRRIELVQRYILFREDAKDFLMLGYDLLRAVALEIGRRLEIGADVFHLTREEMFDALRVGYAPHHLIEQRQIIYRAESRLIPPQLIDSAAIDALGEPAALPTTTGGTSAFPISSGIATGPARIIHSPTEPGDFGQGYILVCPSTDPSWTPLFTNAAGLVLECGGTLSHGAVIAREMGLPAVVLADATRLFRQGQELRVDGTRGWVGPADVAPVTPAPPDEADTRIARELHPPPPGPKDRRAARWRNIAALLWMIYLLAFFLLPSAYVHNPTIALLDRILWPLTRTAGGPATVAIVACAIAAATLLLQRFLTDNTRLREAKRRAAILTRQAAALPPNAPRRAALLRAAAPVQIRILAAAMVPIGLLLGPMVLPFIWFSQRIDPTIIIAPAGSPVQVEALVSADGTQLVRLSVPAPLVIDETTPQAQSLLPLRATLEHLLALYRQPPHTTDEPWELQVAPDLSRQQTADNLQAYLTAGIEPQRLMWLVHPPADWAGRFTITLTADGDPAPVHADVVLGDEAPPARLTTAGPPGARLQQVRVVFPQPAQQPIFWRPFASLAGHGQLAAWLASVNLGWIWVYILTYLPALWLIRTILRIA